jgi:hypothetical protein
MSHEFLIKCFPYYAFLHLHILPHGESTSTSLLHLSLIHRPYSSWLALPKFSSDSVPCKAFIDTILLSSLASFPNNSIRRRRGRCLQCPWRALLADGKHRAQRAEVFEFTPLNHHSYPRHANQHRFFHLSNSPTSPLANYLT